MTLRLLGQEVSGKLFEIVGMRRRTGWHDMADAVGHLRATGEVVPDEWLTHTSPVGWEHIGLSGDFLWDRAAALPVGRRSLNLARRRYAA